MEHCTQLEQLNVLSKSANEEGNKISKKKHSKVSLRTYEKVSLNIDKFLDDVSIFPSHIADIAKEYVFMELGIVEYVLARMDPIIFRGTNLMNEMTGGKFDTLDSDGLLCEIKGVKRDVRSSAAMNKSSVASLRLMYLSLFAKRAAYDFADTIIHWISHFPLTVTIEEAKTFIDGLKVKRGEVILFIQNIFAVIHAEHISSAGERPFDALKQVVLRVFQHTYTIAFPLPNAIYSRVSHLIEGEEHALYFQGDRVEGAKVGKVGKAEVLNLHMCRLCNSSYLDSRAGNQNSEQRETHHVVYLACGHHCHDTCFYLTAKGPYCPMCGDE